MELRSRLEAAWSDAGHGVWPAGDPRHGLRLRRGDRLDYAALSEHHYRAKKPATATRVLVLEDVREGWAARLKAAGYTGVGPCKGVAGSGVVGVLVESLPSLSCRMRDEAFGHRYGSHLDGSERAMLLNDEVRCISRVVVDPRWRGLGLAGWLVREALKTAETPVTEALAAMGKVHPFFARAGMTAYLRPTHDFDLRLMEAFTSAGFAREAFLQPRRLARRVDALPRTTRGWLWRELRQWYRKNAGRSAGYTRDPVEQLSVVRERLGLEPIYYAWVRESNR